MAPLKAKGDLAELMVAADLLRRGYKVAIPYATTDRCYYIPAAELGDARFHMSLRIRAARNNQRVAIRDASAYLEI